jgi:hypothetical protein
VKLYFLSLAAPDDFAVAAVHGDSPPINTIELGILRQGTAQIFP